MIDNRRIKDNRYVRIYDLKQKVRYHPEVGTYISEEDIDLAKTIVLVEYEGAPIGCCQNCGHTVESIHTENKLNCPMWCAVGINPNGFCHMWRPKN